MNRSDEFLERLEEEILIGDGAFGTELYRRGVSLDECYDQLNIEKPDLIQHIHADYIRAGSDIIETNTFGANRSKLARYGLGDQVERICKAGVDVAKRASGGAAFVAGAVGPLPAYPAESEKSDYEDDEACWIFREQLEALANAGADLLILETFSDLREIRLALKTAIETTGLPVVAQMMFHDPEGRIGGIDGVDALASLAESGAVVVGANCGRGVSHVVRIIESFCARKRAKVSAFPNAGFPENVGGRVMYLASPDYVAQSAERMADAGANILGGCCGTNPEVIEAIAHRIKRRRPSVRSIGASAPRTPAAAPPTAPRIPSFIRDIGRRKPILVELDPPYGLDYGATVEKCRRMKALGVDAITMGDSPLATLRMSPVAFAQIVHREVGVETIVHFTCRDRNVIGIQSELMGAWALGVRNVLALTGDPAKMGNQPGASSVYDVNSIGLLKLISGLNEGRNAAGGSLKRSTAFNIGVGFNPNFKNVEFEVKKLKRKVVAGARFALTQLVFDPDKMREAYESAREFVAPIFPAISPMMSERNCEFLHNELPGCRIPDRIRKRMAGKEGEAGIREGLSIAKELIEQTWDCCDGYYVVPPLNRDDLAAKLIEYIRAKQPSRTSSTEPPSRSIDADASLL
jgi:homocysteine S-methyltransferase